MLKLNIALSICLACSAVMALRLSRQANEIRQWALQIPSQVPHHDPRIEAVGLERQIVQQKRLIRAKLVELQHLLPIPDSPPTPKPTVKTIAKKTATENASYERLAAQPMGEEQVGRLSKLIDPQRHPLPNYVRIQDNAIIAWLAVRKKWPPPMGRSEITSISREIGFSQPLLENLDPSLDEHRRLVDEAFKSKKIQASEAMKWLKRFPIAHWKQGRSETPTYARLLNDDDVDPAELQRWMSLWRSDENSNLQRLSVASKMNSTALWKDLSLQASLNRYPTKTLRQFHDHAMWHLARFDDSSSEVIRRLRNNPAFPAADLILGDPMDRSQDLMEDSLNDEVAEAVADWILEIAISDAAKQGELYRKLLEIQPSDRLRKAVLTFSGLGFARDPYAKALSAALWCRWAGQDQLALLIEQAMITNRVRTMPGDPDATAEAIGAVCLNDQAAASQLATFWIRQARWPRTVTQAWSKGGDVAERAFGEALLASDLDAPSSGVQSALNVLATVGGNRTLTVLDLITDQAIADGRRNEVLNRFVRSCRSKITRRIQSEGDLQ